MPILSKFMNPRQVLVCALPTLAVVLSYIWFKKKTRLALGPETKESGIGNSIEVSATDIESGDLVKNTHNTSITAKESNSSTGDTASDTAVKNTYNTTLSAIKSNSSTGDTASDTAVKNTHNTSITASKSNSNTGHTTSDTAVKNIHKPTISATECRNSTVDNTGDRGIAWGNNAKDKDSVEEVRENCKEEVIEAVIVTSRVSPVCSAMTEATVPANMKEPDVDITPVCEAVSGKMEGAVSDSCEKRADGAEDVQTEEGCPTMAEGGYSSGNQSPTEELTEEMVGSPAHSHFSDAASEGSSDSGKGGSAGSVDLPTMSPSLTPPDSSDSSSIYEFEIPQKLCGRLIGRNGTHVNLIKNKTQASILVRNHPVSPRLKLCSIEGSQSDVEAALDMIRQRFPAKKFPSVTLHQVNAPLLDGVSLVSVPETQQLPLPEGVTCDVVISSVVSAGHFFVQQPTHPSFPSLTRLDMVMTACYTQQSTPDMPRPVEVGNICVAPVANGWFRARVVSSYHTEDEVDVKFVDHGGYLRMPVSFLRQIRFDLMSLPFQATECYLANVIPLDETEGWTTEANAVFEEIADSHILLGQVVGFTEDGIPFLNLYRADGHTVSLINHDLVERGVARWSESSLSPLTTQ